MVDNGGKKPDNSSRFYISNGEDTMIINKRDLVWQKMNHDHHYLPDFSDETDVYVALKCAKSGCIHGVLQRKEGKEFMNWLEERRADS